MTKRRQKYPQQLPDHSLWFRHKLAPKTYGQEFYINAINENDIVLCQGPAGTGKTWIVTRLALEALNSNDVSKIVVTKPILEAGDEEIGFLPGEVDDKIAPHFQSVIDCFEDHIGPAKTKQLIDDGKIEFLPTAYCRGRSINNCVGAFTRINVWYDDGDTTNQVSKPVLAQTLYHQLQSDEYKGKIKALSYNEETRENEYQTITASMCTIQPEIDVYEMTLSDGRVITATEDHLFFTQNRGYVKLKDLTEDDILLSMNESFIPIDT